MVARKILKLSWQTIAATILISSHALGSVIGPLDPSLVLADLQVSGETESHFSLLQKLAKVAPHQELVLLPVFTKCKMSCPVIARAIKRAALSLSMTRPEIAARVQYVLLSFDVTDEPKDLASFRKHDDLPSNWLIVRADDQEKVREYFDRFKYSIMSDDGGFNHPNQFFILNQNHAWANTVYGTDFSDNDLKQAILGSIETENPSRYRRSMQWISNPENMALVGGFGLLLAVIFSMVLITRRKKAPSVGDVAVSRSHET